MFDDCVVVIFGDCWYYFEQDGVQFSYILDLCSGVFVVCVVVVVIVVVFDVMYVDVWVIVLMVMGVEMGFVFVCVYGLVVCFVICGVQGIDEYLSLVFVQLFGDDVVGVV